MSDTESLDYLQTGFDPSSLTVPRLRSILVQYNIPYPSSAKKSQLVEIFQENVLPQSRKILSARARARRTSKGITDADSQDTIVDDDELMPPPPTPRPKSARKPSSRIKSEESESDVSSVRSPAKRTPRPSKFAKASDTETGTDAEVKKSVRKSRKSEAPVAATPVAVTRVKREDDDGAGVSRRESNFSFDNPFQSGSSPPTDISSGERPRKGLGSSRDPSKRKSNSTTRRRTEGAKEDGTRASSEKFEIPVQDISRSIYKKPVQSIEPSEEFTPEEQLELTREQAANGLDPLPLRPRQQSRGIGKGPIWIVLLTLLSGYATWYRQEKLAVGYCGIGREAHQIVPANVEVPDWFKILLEPECEPCPQHAYCSENLETHCESDFILKPHPLSVGGLVPFTPTCEPDGEKVRRVKVVADRAIEELRERRAKFECGELVDDAGVPEPTVEIDADDLKKEVSKKRRKGMGEAEFEELWAGAIGEIAGREEVESRVEGFLVASTDSKPSSPPTPSLESPSAAPSDDHSDSLWQDIASKLLL